MTTSSDQQLDLASVRANIDALDNQIHDLLMQRAELVDAVLAAKKKTKAAIVQPAREAKMIRRLLERHKGMQPKESVVRIWREIIGAGALLQGGLKVSVAAETLEDQNVWDCARDYFGSLVPMTRAQNPIAAISQLREGTVDFIVLPWPDVEEAKPWWNILGSDIYADLQIIQRLPFGYADADKQRPAGIVLGKAGFDATGDDRTFLIVRAQRELSRAGLMDRLAKGGLKPVALYASQTPNHDGVSQDFLIEVEGYFQTAAELPQELEAALQDYETSITVTGGYPAPPVYAAFNPTAARKPRAKQD